MSLLLHLSSIPDPRHDRNKRHKLVDVIFLVFSAILSGATGWKSIEQFGEEQLEWLQKHGLFQNGFSPSRHCIAYIIKSLQSEALINALCLWINQRREQLGKPLIALDGKTLRGTGNVLEKSLHLVSAYDVDNGLSLYQKSAASKGQEGVAAREIIQYLALEGRIITMDALHCQVETLEQIIQSKGDFVIQVKANQKTLYEHIQASFKAAYNSEYLSEYVQSNKGHGREEYRAVMQLPATLPDDLKARWPHIRSFIEVASERTHRGKTSCDSRWYVSSLQIDAKQAAHAVRQHWGIENSLHWVLDVVFREDEMTISTENGAAHVALFNRVALSVIKQHTGKKDSIAAKRRGAAWNPDFRTELIFG
jgi:predicted transposase YbfD/YdcC